MQINVSGKQVDVGQSLQDHVKSRLTATIEKYFPTPIDAHVVFSKERYNFRADIRVNIGTRDTKFWLNADHAATDPYLSFDGALGHIENQLRRYKERLKGHRKPEIAALNKTIEGRKYVLEHDNEKEVAQENHPLIIAEKSTEIEVLSVSDAVMKMDLANLPALMFINLKNGCLNVVYRRSDGNISWVDPNYPNQG